MAIYTALSVTWAFSRLSYGNSRLNGLPDFINDPETLRLFVAFLVVVLWSVLCLCSAMVRSWQLRQELKKFGDNTTLTGPSSLPNARSHSSEEGNTVAARLESARRFTV